MSQDPHRSLLAALPRELQDMIYNYCLEYPQIEPAINQVHSSISAMIQELSTYKPNHIPLRWPRPKYPRLSTPSILLLNKATTRDALTQLHKKPWRLTRPCGSIHQNQGRGPEIWHFIGERSLQSMRHVELSIDFRGQRSQPLWYFTVMNLVKIWNKGNALESIRVEVLNPGDMVTRGSAGRITSERTTAADIVAFLQVFGFEHGVLVTFEGREVGVVTVVEGVTQWIPPGQTFSGQMYPAQVDPNTLGPW